MNQIIQISDLHFGDIDPNTGNPSQSNIMQALVNYSPIVDGLLGHHIDALEDLEDFILSLGYSDQNSAELVVSGDLTRCGAQKEFDNVTDFLHGQLLINAQTAHSVGLDIKLSNTKVVPGNHDHWDGKNFPLSLSTPSHIGYQSYFSNFSTFPYITIQPVSNSVSHRDIVISHINTDSSVTPQSLNRFCARGSFSDQLKSLGPLLQQQKNDCFNILILHHSMTKDGFLLSIDQNCKSELMQFITDHRIKILMCGHTHDPGVEKLVDRNGSDFLECRCGTTTQIDTPPSNFRQNSILFKNITFPINSLLLHNFDLDPSGKIKWESEIYRRSRNRGFVTTRVSKAISG